MDLKINCKKLEIDGWDCSYKLISITLENIDTDVLNTKEIASKIDIKTFFDAYSEDEIKDFVSKNYDWFEER